MRNKTTGASLVVLVLGMSAGMRAEAKDSALELDVAAYDQSGSFRSAGRFLRPSDGHPRKAQVEGVYLGLDGRVLYDSNIFLLPNSTVDDFVFAVAPVIGYKNAPDGSSVFSLDVSYSPIFLGYADNSDLNDIDHLGKVSAAYTTGKTEVELDADYGSYSGGDRFVGSFVQENRFYGRLSGNFKLSEKTTLETRAGYLDRRYDSGNLLDNQTFTAQAGMLWDVTEKTSLGPAVRYTKMTTDGAGDRDTIGGYLRADYAATGKLSIGGQAGVDYVDYDGSGSDGKFRFLVSADYVPNDLWRINLRGYTRTQPSPSSTGYYINSTGVGLGIYREISQTMRLRALGLYENSDYEAVGGTIVNRSTENYFTAEVGASMDLFDDLLTMDLYYRYSENDAGFPFNWDDNQVGLAFSLLF